jgi:hypothetical protein
VIDVSVGIEGEVAVTANGSVVGTATLSNEHWSTFDFKSRRPRLRDGLAAGRRRALRDDDRERARSKAR